jgi:hypothetical protein
MRRSFNISAKCDRCAQNSFPHTRSKTEVIFLNQ